MKPDDRLTWIKSNGDVLNQDIAAANNSVYYAEIPVGRALGFGVTLDWDATEVASYTLESTNNHQLTAYTTSTTSGWKSQATALGTIAAAAALGCGEWQVSDARSTRWRIKRDVTTGGVATAHSGPAKGN